MKKIFTLTLVLLAMAFAGNAQALLSENFDNGLPSTWVIIGKKADISSEYEDLSNEIEIYRRHEPWYLHPY